MYLHVISNDGIVTEQANDFWVEKLSWLYHQVLFIFPLPAFIFKIINFTLSFSHTLTIYFLSLSFALSLLSLSLSLYLSLSLSLFLSLPPFLSLSLCETLEIFAKDPMHLSWIIDFTLLHKSLLLTYVIRWDKYHDICRNCKDFVNSQYLKSQASSYKTRSLVLKFWFVSSFPVAMNLAF